MRRHCASALLITCVLSAVPALADQLVIGKRLLIKNPASGTSRVVQLARDVTVTVGNAGGTADPQCSGAGGGGASSLLVAASGGVGGVVIPLPCGGWTTNGSNTLYRYRDPSGATCRVVIVKHHLFVKAVCSGPHVDVDLNGGAAPVGVAVTLNAERYCTAFGGTLVHDGSDGQTFLARDALAPGACAETTTISTSTSTSTTTPTYCCALPGRCTFSNPAHPEFCVPAGGTLYPDYGCDGGTGNCVAGTGVAGPCCQMNSMVPNIVSCTSGPSVNSANCVSGGSSIATFYPSAVCTTAGTCEP
jgi:hypothetical protein